LKDRYYKSNRPWSRDAVARGEEPEEVVAAAAVAVAEPEEADRDDHAPALDRKPCHLEEEAIKDRRDNPISPSGRLESLYTTPTTN
jgi:hypothetical protein